MYLWISHFSVFGLVLFLGMPGNFPLNVRYFMWKRGYGSYAVLQEGLIFLWVVDLVWGGLFTDALTPGRLSPGQTLLAPRTVAEVFAQLFNCCFRLILGFCAAWELTGNCRQNAGLPSLGSRYVSSSLAASSSSLCLCSPAGLQESPPAFCCVLFSALGPAIPWGERRWIWASWGAPLLSGKLAFTFPFAFVIFWCPQSLL